MARDYAIVRPSYWTGETGRKLRTQGPIALLVGQYLMTCATSNLIGLYYLPVITIAHECALPVEGARKALGSASEVGFAYYDEDREEVWVPEMAAHQVARRVTPKDNRHKAIVREAENYKKSKFFRAFVDRYGAAFELPPDLIEEALPSPFGGPTKPLRRPPDHVHDFGLEGGDEEILPAPISPSSPTVDQASARERGPEILLANLTNGTSERVAELADAHVNRGSVRGPNPTLATSGVLSRGARASAGHGGSTPPPLIEIEPGRGPAATGNGHRGPADVHPVRGPPEPVRPAGPSDYVRPGTPCGIEDCDGYTHRPGWDPGADHKKNRGLRSVPCPRRETR